MTPPLPSRLASAAGSKLEQSFVELLQSCTLSEADEQRLATFAKTLRKHEQRAGFKYERAMNDKAIATNMLDQTIVGLRERSVELEEKERSLSATVEQLRLANDDMQHFMHVASHDLKTPLRSIGSFAGLIARRYGEALPEGAAEYFGFIRQSAAAMNRVIDDLVRYNGASHLEQAEDVNFDEVGAEILLNLHADIEEAGAEVTIDALGSGAVPRSAVSQLLQNLVRNALVYRDTERPAHVRVYRADRDGQLILAVADNGVGLSNEYHEKAFAPFKRVGDVSRPGTGMGLAICRRIARQLGGDVTFDGQVGVGTTFYVRLG